MTDIDAYISVHEKPTIGRRTALKAGAAAGAFAAFAALGSQPAGAQGRSGRKSSPDYGPLYPTRDLVTGLELLALPEGFSYMSYGWTGQIMDDGRPTPTDHDGMAVVAQKMNGSQVVMVRNHENSEGEGPQAFVEGGMYNPRQFGGTTNLVFDLKKKRFVESYNSLGGTVRNCAGGLTPWRSWISCEETFHTFDDGRFGDVNHGYIFDVPAYRPSNGVPIRSAGRFSHEAVAVDPRTGIVYETEDARPSGLFAYHNPGGPGHLEDGGDLYAYAITDDPGADLSASFANGTRFQGEWVKVEDPEGREGRPLDSAPGAALFSRLEGIWYTRGNIVFISTDGGDAGLGQVWLLNPKNDELRLIYESTDPAVLDGPDNVAATAAGALLLCEDGDSDPKRMIGLSRSGDLFDFCHNNIELKAGDIDVIDGIYPGTKDNFWDDAVGDYTSREWAGATFHGDWLFANIQSPGVTFAITGPWFLGALG